MEGEKTTDFRKNKLPGYKLILLFYPLLYPELAIERNHQVSHYLTQSREF